MINGVLVERTVKDVVPSLKTNSDGLKKVLDELMKTYKNKQDEMDSWKVWPVPSQLRLYGDSVRLARAGANAYCFYRKRTTSRSSSSDHLTV